MPANPIPQTVSQEAREFLQELVGLRGPRATKALDSGEYDDDWRMLLIAAFEAQIRADCAARFVERVEGLRVDEPDDNDMFDRAFNQALDEALAALRSEKS